MFWLTDQSTTFPDSTAGQNAQTNSSAPRLLMDVPMSLSLMSSSWRVRLAACAASAPARFHRAELNERPGERWTGVVASERTGGRLATDARPPPLSRAAR